MPDPEHHTALLPVPVTPIADSNTVHEEAEEKKHIPENTACPAVLIRKILLFLFSSAAVFVFSVIAIVLVLRSGIGGDTIIRLLLADVFGSPGGSLENIRTVTLEEARYLSVQPDREYVLSEYLPLDPVSAPEEKKRPVLSTPSFTNETPYEPDMSAILASERVTAPADELYRIHGKDAPLVLILHTHGTEAFSDSEDTGYRSTDPEQNIVSAGKVIADMLEENGIGTIHCTTMFDAQDFTMAYYNASLEIRRTLEAHPSVSYIIDVHRDSIESDGVHMAPTVSTENGSAAQMMFVVGTDHGGADHSGWENNLALAARLHAAMDGKTPQLMRPINLRSASFNAQYSSGSLLLEIGACASSLDEIHRSAALFAEALTDEILGK